MIYNNLKLAVRSLWRDRFYAILNLVGLAVGISVCMLLFSFTHHQFSFDGYHKKKDKIYRLGLTATYDGSEEKWANVPNIAGPHFKDHIADIVEQVRLLKHNFGRTAFLSHGDRNFADKAMYWADSSVFTIFDIDLLAQEREILLSEPNQIALSASTKTKIFGDEDAIGKTINIDNDLELKVVAVYQDFPSHSSVQANMIGSLSTLDWAYKRLYWGNASFETYLLMGDEIDPALMHHQITDAFNQVVKAEDRWFSFWIQPLSEVHLHSSDISNSYSDKPGDIQQVKMVLWLGFIVLILACFNYINMATARARGRLKEIGINKTLGASSFALAQRFLSETAVLVIAATLIGSTVAIAVSPVLQQLADQSFPVGMFFKGAWLLSLPLLIITVTLFAGAYPAFILSGFSPKDIFSPSSRRISTSPILRNSMVVAQYIACITLIASSLVFAHQMKFISQKKLGFQPEQVVAVTTAAAENRQSISGLMNAYYALPEVEQVCRATTYPGNSAPGYSMHRPGEPEKIMAVASNSIGPRFEEVLDLKLIAGRSLDSKAEGDTTIDVVMNETAIEFLGWTPEGAIGKTPPQLYQRPTKIVGVVEDFHFESLHRPIGAYAFNNGRRMNWQPFLLVRLNTPNLRLAIKKLENTFATHLPNSAFEYVFLDEEFDQLYAGEKRLVQVVLIFTILAILISCLGLIGLTAFRAEQRTREIGIRKVLGATAGNVVWLLSRDLLRLVVLAIVVAVPMAWFVTDQWLQDFAYRITPGIHIFVLAVGIALVIALATTGTQSLRAALVHPSESLKNKD